MTPPPTTDPSPPSPSSSSPSSPSISDEVEIREVWDENLESEICLIRDIIDDYPYVAMDTEFPGIVLRPLAPSPTPTYSTLKANVDLLKLIQLGLTLTDSLGRLPRIGPQRRPSLWQFNFRDFDPLVDVFARDSLDLLRRSGIDFQLNSTRGIPCLRFAEFLISSGVVLNPDVQWITFHSGYDFGYLLKALTCRPLPDTLEGFFELINVYFPVIYDMKHLMKYCNSLHGGLNRLAELLEVERIGVSHQAGSDSLLTGEAFRKLRDVYFGGDASKYAGVLFGLEMNTTTTTTTTTTGVTNAAGVNAITTAGISIPRCV